MAIFRIIIINSYAIGLYKYTTFVYNGKSQFHRIVILLQSLPVLFVILSLVLFLNCLYHLLTFKFGFIFLIDFHSWKLYLQDIFEQLTLIFFDTNLLIVSLNDAWLHCICDLIPLIPLITWFVLTHIFFCILAYQFFFLLVLNHCNFLRSSNCFLHENLFQILTAASFVVLNQI